MSLLAKALIALVVVLLAVVVACVSGATFYLWPTSLADHKLDVTSQTLNQLAAFKAERKFTEDKVNFYFGAPTEADRASAQAAVDAVISRLQAELPANPRRSVVLGIFKQAQASFVTVESEERDQFLVYLVRIMGILGVTSSGELLNVWRYGFPYGWFLGGGHA